MYRQITMYNVYLTKRNEFMDVIERIKLNKKPLHKTAANQFIKYQSKKLGINAIGLSSGPHRGFYEFQIFEERSSQIF